MRVAAIDIGTNTVRLLIAERTAGGYRDVTRRLLFTRLGEGVDASKSLAEAGTRRSLRAVTEFASLCGELGVDRLRVVGTSALRDASNTENFLLQVAKLTGTDAEVLEGDEEARLSFIGATFELGFGLYLVQDIGGGSTEFVLGEPEPTSSGTKARIKGKVSLDIGAVRLTERFLLSDPPATEEILTMEGAIDDGLEHAESLIGDPRDAQFIGVAGTTTSLAAMHLGLERYDPEQTHRLKMERTSVKFLYKTLAEMDLHSRMQIPALPEGRADVIVAGASILARTMDRWDFSEVNVSEKDILDGLVLDQLEIS